MSGKRGGTSCPQRKKMVKKNREKQIIPQGKKVLTRGRSPLKRKGVTGRKRPLSQGKGKMVKKEGGSL